MKPFVSIILFTLLVTGCTITAPRGKQSWSKKPYFASLMLDDVHYTLSSLDNKYSLNKPVDFKLVMKNSSDSKKTFKTTDNKFVVCTIKAEHTKITNKIVLNSTDIIKKANFSILPNEERVFDFSIELSDDIIKNNKYLYSQINLYFLKRQLRRNSLTIYLERQ
ncbi:MAG: hypothetical protein PF574_04500 [Candidatus Delongbacteria bacterium]|jgi:hypothetical protein|nr:hypothetical protein [Candidatus Delongbacteria bacterium]